jgi:hypothetical protein
MAKECVKGVGDGRITALFSDPGNWIQGTFAMDKMGDFVCANHPDAVCFCLSGALLRMYPGMFGSEQYKQTVDAVKKLGYCQVFHFNDDVTHAEVLNLCKELNL